MNEKIEKAEPEVSRIPMGLLKFPTGAELQVCGVEFSGVDIGILAQPDGEAGGGHPQYATLRVSVTHPDMMTSESPQDMTTFALAAVTLDVTGLPQDDAVLHLAHEFDRWLAGESILRFGPELEPLPDPTLEA